MYPVFVLDHMITYFPKLQWQLNRFPLQNKYVDKGHDRQIKTKQLFVRFENFTLFYCVMLYTEPNVYHRLYTTSTPYGNSSFLFLHFWSHCTASSFCQVAILCLCSNSKLIKILPSSIIYKYVIHDVSMFNGKYYYPMVICN